MQQKEKDFTAYHHFKIIQTHHQPISQSYIFVESWKNFEQELWRLKERKEGTSSHASTLYAELQEALHALDHENERLHTRVNDYAHEIYSIRQDWQSKNTTREPVDSKTNEDFFASMNQ